MHGIQRGYFQLHTIIKNHFETDNEAGLTLVFWPFKMVPEPMHWHQTLEVCYCLEGRGIFSTAKSQYEITPGDIILVNNMEYHTAHSSLEEPCLGLFLFFEVAVVETFDPELLRIFVYDPHTFVHKIPGHLPLAQRIGEILLEMQEESMQQRPAFRKILKSLLLHLCALLARYHASSGNSEDRSTHYHKFMQLRPAIEYIQMHPGTNMTLAEIANVLSLSPSRTRHLFQEVMGEGFKTYLLRLRIQQARRQLASTDLSILEIAGQNGFQNVAAFHRTFKQLTGMTPQEYRKSCNSIALSANNQNDSAMPIQPYNLYH